MVGVVICRGKSPGSAANKVINAGIVESEQASIVMIPPEREADFIPYEDKLLDMAAIKSAFPSEPFVLKFLDNEQNN